MSKSVCIINCIGSLGSELTVHLLKNGYNVIGLVPSIFNARDMDHMNALENKYPGLVDLYEYESITRRSLLPLLKNSENVICDDEFQCGYAGRVHRWFILSWQLRRAPI
jgi:GDP-D-mannose dehydratase